MTNDKLRAKLPSRFAQYPLFNCQDVNDDAAVLIAYQFCIIQEQNEAICKLFDKLIKIQDAAPVAEKDNREGYGRQDGSQ